MDSMSAEQKQCSEPRAGLVTVVALWQGRGGQHLPGYSCSGAGLQVLFGGVKGTEGKLLSLGWLTSVCPAAVSTSGYIGEGRSSCGCHLSEVGICQCCLTCDGHLLEAAICLQSPICGGPLPEADICLRFSIRDDH